MRGTIAPPCMLDNAPGYQPRPPRVHRSTFIREGAAPYFERQLAVGYLYSTRSIALISTTCGVHSRCRTRRRALTLGAGIRHHALRLTRRYRHLRDPTSMTDPAPVSWSTRAALLASIFNTARCACHDRESDLNLAILAASLLLLRAAWLPILDHLQWLWAAPLLSLSCASLHAMFWM
ncbi:hypothetical protein HYPSUDRAFT_894840 [Hypholoma sublateritium FD-334 SS-4]|uniref:Uncharacterized protein n=1 Tax=Hypholoma sublateritium (strain FD-334 SS-4) TaxID=945553 RepID=A0A0D2M7S5_HYPSF|nr:hypothetical protein HYPSUDRAFT_894840 [Hypholoma sublateritium FD-334 SS-4]